MTYTKTSPGTACNIADELCASWVFVKDWQEAVMTGDTNCVCYRDNTGYYVRSDILGQ